MPQPLRSIAVLAPLAFAAIWPLPGLGDAGTPAAAGSAASPKALTAAAPSAPAPSAGGTIVEAIARAQPKVVKIYGAGGYRGM